MSRFRWLLWMSALGYPTWTVPGYGYALRSEAGAVSNELEDLAINPANAGFITQSKFGLRLDALQRQTLKYRFPETDTGQKSTAKPLDLTLGLDSMPFNYVANPLPGLGVGILLAPPLELGNSLNLERLPIALLGTIDYVDIKVSDMKLNSFAAASVGYRLSRTLALGVSFRQVDASALATIRTASTQALLTTAQIKIKDTSAKLGLRWAALPRTLEFGFASTLISSRSLQVSVAENLPAGLAPAATSGKSRLLNPLDHFVVGLHAINGSHHVFVDGERKVADKEQKTVSLKDFKLKKRDVYDTFALRVGYTLMLDPAFRLHLGTSFEPSAIGPGSNQADGLSGFGTLDLIPIVGLGDFVRPYRQYTGGVSFHFYTADGRNRKRKPRETLALALGFSYRTATLGIDASGVSMI